MGRDIWFMSLGLCRICATRDGGRRTEEKTRRKEEEGRGGGTRDEGGGRTEEGGARSEEGGRSTILCAGFVQDLCRVRAGFGSRIFKDFQEFSRIFKHFQAFSRISGSIDGPSPQTPHPQ